MTDKESSLLNEGFNNHKIVNTDSYITENIKTLLNKKWGKTFVDICFSDPMVECFGFFSILESWGLFL